MIKIKSFTLISSILSFSILIICDSLLTSKSYSKPSMEFPVKNPYHTYISRYNWKCICEESKAHRYQGLYLCQNQDGVSFYKRKVLERSSTYNCYPDRQN